MQTVYEWRFEDKKGDIIEIGKENLITHPSDNLEDDYCLKSVKEIRENIDQIDKTIEIAAPDWPLEKIDNIDLAILTVGVYELLFREDIPPKVAIDEAVELGKEFGGENTAPFVNGVLGTVFRASDRHKGAESEKINNPRKKEQNDKEREKKD
jgi:N utilization substance protein B